MIYLNGKFIPEEEFKIAPNDRGLLLADGIFETMRAYQGKVFCLEEHYARLCAAAAVLELPISLSLQDVKTAINELLQVNNLLTQDASLRLTLTRGPGPRGILPPLHPNPTIMIAAFPLNSLPHTPMKLHISTIRRNEHSPTSQIKSLCYLDNILAKKEAEKNGDDEAIFLNTQGNIACTCIGNIFIVTANGAIITPPLTDGILPGITRQTVINICQENNISLSEKSIGINDLLSAAEVFITNSILEIQPVISVKKQLIGNGQIGEITKILQNHYYIRTKEKSSMLEYKNSEDNTNILFFATTKNPPTAEPEQTKITENKNTM